MHPHHSVLHFEKLKYYPIFLDLRGRRVLVAGAGKVALRKTRGLVGAGALVTVVAPVIRPEFRELPVRLIERRYRVSDLRGAALVFAATDDRAVNRQIGAAARHRAILANIADAAEECDFIVPARVQHGIVEIAIATGGRNPRVSAELRRKLESNAGGLVAGPSRPARSGIAASTPRGKIKTS
ncbi:MAG TPA: bifunctional precorrin-2 dehydrogenase/sirohydrochlorin ferrochelatase [Bryobacteraceae bacterium]|nr:bifunctional precorrin-2 dehydrogenase/sirohydrochlorin ferrochelatase [Bryobacteraceae bacterium]